MDHNLSTKYGSYLLPTYFFYYKNRSSHRLIKHVLSFSLDTMKPAGSRGRRRTDHGRNDGGSDRLWLFLSYTYFSPRPSSGGNLFDLRPRRIAFGSPSSARPPPCSCGGATWAGYLDNPLFVSYITGNLSSGACGELKFPVIAADSCTLPTNRDPAACGVSLALRRRPSSARAYL